MTTMPANMQSETGLREQAAVNGQPVASFLMRLKQRLISTAGGWAMRQALKLASVASASATTYLTTKLLLVEQAASQQGVSADTLAGIHEQGAALIQVIGAVMVTMGLGTVEMILSRLAATVAEEPIVPRALPVEDEGMRKAGKQDSILKTITKTKP